MTDGARPGERAEGRAPHLTILLPLKGRPLHTLRFLWHANRTRLPFRILIADGEVHPTVARLLEDRATFPDADFDYVRYPDDLRFTDFFRKMAHALGRVRTPYVMLADNDDFVLPAGVNRCIDFLAANPDYVCCAGGIGGFELGPGRDALAPVVGPLVRLAYRYSPHDRSLDLSSDSAAERVFTGYRESWTYYGVYRAPALATIWNEVCEIDFSDLQHHERFCALRTLTLGKARSDPAVVAYLRQYSTSLRTAFASDWVDHLVHSRFTGDLDALVDRIAREIAPADESGRAQAAERLRALTADRLLRPFLIQAYGTKPLALRLKLKLYREAPALTSLLMRVRHLATGERRAFVAALRRDGATPAYLEAFARELAGIEDVLTGSAFVEFLRRRAPDLMPGGSVRAASAPEPSPARSAG